MLQGCFPSHTDLFSMTTSPHFVLSDPSEAGTRVADKWSAILLGTDDGEQPVIFDTALLQSDSENASSSWITDESGNTVRSDRSTSVEPDCLESLSDSSGVSAPCPLGRYHLRNGIETDFTEADSSSTPESDQHSLPDSDDSDGPNWEGVTPENVPPCPLQLHRDMTPFFRPDDHLRLILGEEQWNSCFPLGPPEKRVKDCGKPMQ